MSYIETKVKAAKAISALAYHFYEIGINSKTNRQNAIYWRALAVVQHDRVLNNR